MSSEISVRSRTALAYKDAVVPASPLGIQGVPRIVGSGTNDRGRGVRRYGRDAGAVSPAASAKRETQPGVHQLITLRAGPKINLFTIEEQG